MLLLILAALPALALTVFNSVSQRSVAESQAREDITNLARVGAQQQSQIVDGAKQLLIGFSLIPSELRNERARCTEYVRQVLQKTGRLYFSMGLYGPDGEVQCVGTLLDRTAHRAVESGQLSIGEFPRAQLAKPDGFTLSYPIVDALRGHHRRRFCRPQSRRDRRPCDQTAAARSHRADHYRPQWHCTGAQSRRQRHYRPQTRCGAGPGKRIHRR